MGQSITDALSEFSRKLERFNKAAEPVRTVTPSKETVLEHSIEEREERFRATVLSTYAGFRAPFDALGKNSSRADSIARDEQELLDAYNLFKSCMAFMPKDGDKKPLTYLKKIEICSPLTEKASYTKGAQLIYLTAWLYFEKNCRDYLPAFTETAGKYELTFIPAEQQLFSAHDREIFSLIESEFYAK